MSGSEKRKKKQKIEQDNETQKGSMHRFLKKNSYADVQVNEQDNLTHETIFNEQDNVLNENVSQEKVSNENVDFDDEKINNEDVNVNNENVNISNENENENVMNDNNEQFIPPLDIYDPSNWDNLDNNLRDILIEKWPIRESNFVYPKDNLSRHFSYASYTRKLSNANDGFNDWKHLFDRLKEHENSSQHLFCMDSWDELIARFDKNKTIDKDLQNTVLTEKERWRNEGYAISIDNAKAIASDMEVEPIFPKKRQITRKKQFDEINCEDELLSPEESFRIEYFIYIVDVAIASLEGRFEQLTNFENIFGFLYDSKRLKSLDDIELKKSCVVCVNKFTHNNLCDVDLNEFLTELKVLQKTLPNVVMSSVEILEFVKGKDCYPNVCIAYRILLTIPVTIASTERNFSKLKLLKNYLRSSMSQERLNGLAMLCIEKDLLDNIELDSIIDDFASKKARKCKFL
ncbi:spindle assembly checkpoint component MAD1-like [Lactuca sativa]|uniref:spindle assembly checkpoint component MAD1-like n=1 Tax=Lactuca sativa TaxID=4236 RepID=UPI0022AF4C3F|nr:spindle assembly checkpoint component MAD1-like [Lactuca sativa]